MTRITLEFDVDDSVPLNDVYIVAGTLATLDEDDYDPSLIRIINIYVDADYGNDANGPGAEPTEEPNDEKASLKKAMWDWVYDDVPTQGTFTTTNHGNTHADATTDPITKGLRDLQEFWRRRDVR